MPHLSLYHSIGISVGWALLLIALERRFPADRGQKLFREGFFLDLFWYTVFEGAVLGFLIGALITFIDTRTGFSRWKLVSGWPMPVQLAFFWVTHDLYIYGFHRLQHKNRWLWRTHEAHHSGKDVDWLSGARSHSLEILINQTIEYAPITLLGAHPDVAIMKGILDACWGMFIHSNIDVKMGPLQYVFNGPEMHRMHHSSVHAKTANFATKIAIWDWIFGTAYRPGKSAGAYGLFGDPHFPKGYFRQHLWAFRPFDDATPRRTSSSSENTSSTVENPSHTLAMFFRALALAGALCILVRTLSQADLRGARLLIAESGPLVLLGFLPFAVTMGIDVLVQQSLLVTIGQKAKYHSLYLVRLVTEALSTSLPAGVVFAESVGPVLLQRHGGVAIDAAVVANTTKRWLTIRAHSGYLAISAWLGYATLSRVSPALRLGDNLVWIVCASSALLFLVSSAIGAVLAGRAWPERVARRLRVLPIARLHAWLDRSHDSLVAMDRRLARLTGDKRILGVASITLLSAWLMESIETWLILHLLGAKLGFAEVIAFEAGLSLVRSAVFFIPAGLGVQDVGYIAFFSALGLPGAATLGAAFVALKRTKEAIWIIIGWVLAGGLALSRTRPAVGPMTLSEEALP